MCLNRAWQKTRRQSRLFWRTCTKASSLKIAKDVAVLHEVAIAQGADPAAPISIADVPYLEEIANRTRFALDSQRLSEYFEFNSILEGFMTVAKKLFGSARSVMLRRRYGIRTCVRLISSMLIKHSSATSVISTHEWTNTNMRQNFPCERQNAWQTGRASSRSAALVWNFAKPGDTPVLMTHDEVTTLFHEFGHALHELLSQAELTNQAGTHVAWDFVETPSQLLEEFAWSRESLDLFARNYKTGEPLPQDLYDAMTRTRSLGKPMIRHNSSITRRWTRPTTRANRDLTPRR